MRTTIAGNWKLNLGLKESQNLFESISKFLDQNPSPATTVVFPQAILAPIIARQSAVGNSLVKVGTQNISNFESGAYTGELSGAVAAEVGFEYALIGHSERRHVFLEKNAAMLDRINLCLKHKLQVIYCVGELLEEREKSLTNQVLETQLDPVLSLLKTGNIKIAYEPVWAIGTGKTATSKQAGEAHEFIRNFVVKKTSADTAKDLSILYGGSVKVDNAAELLETPGVNGLLIGGTSLKLDDFCKIIAMAK